jgi:hypothetical protein
MMANQENLETLAIIGHALNATSVPETAGFLMAMKDSGPNLAQSVDQPLISVWP